jgi:4-aminobutyrate aminotransferase / (S)-3-amino-2-methylpropionate transaminase / 5-aminovalerate transaminase
VQEVSLTPSVLSLAEVADQFVPRAMRPAHPLVMARAEGSRIWDVDGREFIDFAGGIGVLNVGQGHPAVLAAAHQQLDRLVHTSYQVAAYEPYLRLVERLCPLAPGTHPKKALLLNSGAEAVENAVKIARLHTGRPAVIAFEGAFHGRTLLTMSLTGTERPYKEGFGPFVREVHRAPYPYEYRGWSSSRALGALESQLAGPLPPETVAAMVVEPVLGEGGFVPAPAAFLRGLRAICDRHGILLIVDEVQSGIGRTGRLFAIEHAGVEPDLITVAKSLAGGLPLSAVIGRAYVMDSPGPGSLGGTFCGNPVACAAALAVLDVIESEGILARAEVLGSVLEERFADWQRRYRLVGDARNLGAMAGLELVQDREQKTPAGDEAADVVAGCRAEGLLLLLSGPAHNVIRTLMPLNIEEDLLLRGLDILERQIARVDSAPPGCGP